VLLILGSLGVVQALFLPGYVASRVLGVRGAARLATASLGLSLPINFALTAGLVAAELQGRGVWLAVFAVELALAWWLTRRAQAAGSGPAPAAPRSPGFSIVEAAAALALAALALWYAGRAARAASGIFSGWDDVASWNRWAMSWFHRTLPDHTWNYPQSLPVAWAVTYAFMGTDLVQSFARGMMPLFGLGAMLALAASGGPERRLRSLAAAWFAGNFLARANNVTAGLADLPVACLAAIAMAEFLREGDDSTAAGAHRPPRGVLLALFVASAALVKQAGLFLALVLPALHALREPRGGRRRAALLGYGIVAALVTPWYALKQIEIASGRETSEVAHVLTAAHASLDPLVRARDGLARLAEIAGGAPVLVVLFALGLLGLRDHRVRPLLLGVAIPFTVLWLFGFSYDPRNLSIGLTAWALGCGAGLASLPGLAAGPRFALARPRVPARVVAAAFAAALVALAAIFPDRRLLDHQRRLQRGLGDPEVAGTLADLRDSGALTGRIAAEPGVLLAYAPGWDTCFVIVPVADPAALRSALARPEVDWAVLSIGARGTPIPEGSSWRLERVFTQAALWKRRR